MRIAIDTNILAYAEGVNGLERKQDALKILRSHAEGHLILPIQALGELFSVLTRKARWPNEKARSAILAWLDSYDTIQTTTAILLDAMELVTSHQFALWDAIMVAGAAQAECRILLSEDMHDGFTWRGVTVKNPFSNHRS